MFNIILIGTIHSEKGQCNSDKLYKILEDINPEVIFEELPIHFSEMFYSESFDMIRANILLLNRPAPEIPLEVKCIKKYKQNYKVKILPVDVDVRQKTSRYQDEFSLLFSTFFKCEAYEKLDNEKDALVKQDGFFYLNSTRFLDFLEEKEVLEKNIMDSDIQRNRLLDIYNLFQREQYDNRENAMLENIYNYSKENQYNQAVFLIGAEHKKSVVQKITEYEKFSEIKLNWKMFGKK